ncbi:hypothetical protein EMWEY_00048020 [Eimeria maxima]|uniref:Uncharacterized protein n=1 Tax=Eimeria maxima TaxID=5804 RepID=U6M902_EIMMA|nr:hypothetical protein EMWEY_00048020 [Eimeria maxima]CDJ58135.1 hypothetical protein EMWEY_00048020 [Eimeria maxima]
MQGGPPAVLGGPLLLHYKVPSSSLLKECGVKPGGSVHPSIEWQEAGAQVVQEVQHFMSVANFSDSIYRRLLDEEEAEDTPQHTSDP